MKNQIVFIINAWGAWGREFESHRPDQLNHFLQSWLVMSKTK